MNVEIPDDGIKYRKLIAIIDSFDSGGFPTEVEVWVDVYDVLNAFEVKDHGYAHAVKKMLNPGQRGHKDETQDRDNILESVFKSNSRYIKFNKKRYNNGRPE